MGGTRRRGCDDGGVSTAHQTTQAPRPAASGTDRRRKRLASYTVRNMVLSVIPVAALALVWWSLTYNPQELRRNAVEVDVTANHAVAQADWPVWVPEPGEGWTPTVAWYDTYVEGIPTWHVSYVTPEGEYAAVHQAADVTDAWRDQVLGGGEPVGEAVLPGPLGEQTWAAFEAESGNAEHAWVLEPEATGGATLVVHGTAEVAEVEQLLESVEVRD